MGYISPTVVGGTASSFSPRTPRRSIPGYDDDLPETPHTGDSTLVGDSPGLGYGEGKRGHLLPGQWDDDEEDGEGNEQVYEDGSDGDMDLTYLSITPDPQDIDSSDDDMGKDSAEISIIVSDGSGDIS